MQAPGLLILFHWFVCLFLCQEYNVLITLAFCQFWNGEVWVLSLCSFSRLFWLFWILCISRAFWDLDKDCIQSTNQFGKKLAYCYWNYEEERSNHARGCSIYMTMAPFQKRQHPRRIWNTLIQHWCPVKKKSTYLLDYLFEINNLDYYN